MTDFKANPQNKPTAIVKRSSTDFLPSGVGFIKDSDKLSKFLDITLDQWMQPAQLREDSGYIGDKSGLYYNPALDFYLQEDSKDRTNYQLEATTVSVDNNQNINYVSFFQDLNNQLAFHGAITNNQNRLYSQEFYSWAPPINPDTFINFSNYYWLISGSTTINISDATNAVLDIIGQTEYTTTSNITLKSGMRIRLSNDANGEYNNVNYIVEGVGTSIILIDDSEFDGFGLYDAVPYDTGPYDGIGTTAADYITMTRGSSDFNAWSRTNRWFHKDLIANLNLDNFSAFQARRPIIEFNTNLELYNYGRYARKDATFISTVDGILDIAGRTTYVLDGIEISDDDLILFTNDPDPLKNNRVYRVFGLNAYGVVGLSLETDGLDPTGAPVELEKIRIRKGDVYFDTEFYFKNGMWNAAQAKTSANQEPLFVLYDHENIRLDDTGIYPENNFTGSKIFNYIQDSTQANDVYLGFPIKFDTFGNIKFNNAINTQRFNYVLNFTNTEIIGYYFYNKFSTVSDSLDEYENDWHKSNVESRQFVLDNFTIIERVTDTGLIEFDRLYTLSITPDTNTPTTIPNLYVFLNGLPLKENVNYQIIGNVIELSLSLTLANNDVLEIKSFAQTIDTVETNGYFQIPKNLEANPTNEEIRSISFGDLHGHFASIINNQIGFSGISTGVNNYYDTPRDLSQGSYILQHTAPLTNTMLVNNQNNNLDFLTALRFVNREYTRFKRKFINKINSLYTQGYNDMIPASTWVRDALNQINIGKTVGFPFYLSGMTGANNYIPSTPSALGVLPVYQPVKFLDNTRLNPVNVIRGHDGTIINAYDNFLDDVILELENQIYNNIVTTYKDKEVQREFDELTVISGYFRDTEYSRNEWLTLTIPAFERWCSDNLVQYKINDSYDVSNPFSWNYSKSHGPDGRLLPGNWRAIYFYFYDTDRPHTNPWELLGFSQKPDWWVAQYGAAPYTGSNIVMWNDLALGKIAQGARAGIHSNLVRPGLLNMIPVDASGNLLNPIQAGIVQDTPNQVFASAEWAFGDMGPGEYTWRMSENYSFSLTESLFLANPAKFIGLAWEADKFTRTNGQYVDSTTFMRKKASDYTVHNEILADGSNSANHGISQWISDYLTSLGLNIAVNFGNLFRDLGVQLGYRVGGFTKNNTLNLISDSFGIVPQEDISTKLYKSNSTTQPIYSGVLIEWTGTGYRVSGYDTVGQKFKIIPASETGKKGIYTLENIVITKFLTPTNTIQEVTYGTEYGSRQAVYNFLLGYQRWLESQGWIFDQIVTSSNAINDFDNSAQQFVVWTTAALQTSDVIVLSPLANEAKIKVPHGQVDNIQMFVNGVYSIIDKNGLGIVSSNYNINRTNDQFVITMNSGNSRGIFGLRLSIVEYEHIILVNNITKFNDIIYQPLLGVRQPRLRAFIQRTAAWDGKPTALGFIINDNTLIDNFEKTTSDISQYFSFDNVESSEITKKVAKHLIGFQDRDYLESLLLSKKTQFEFYRGFIREKGTNNSFQKILRNIYITQTTGFDILEEWAFSLGDYGNTTKKSSIQLQLIQGQFKTNPQQIVFTNVVSTEESNLINVTPTDIRWVLQNPNNSTINQFSLRNFINTDRIDLPNAGYIRTDEPTFSIVNNSDLQTLYTTKKEENIVLEDGNTVWNIIDLNSSWNVFRLCSIDRVQSVIAGATVGAPAKVTLESNHDLNIDDQVYIIGSTQSSPDYEGYQKVVGIVDPTTFEILQPVSTPKTFASGTGPMVLVIKSVRFANITARDNFIPTNGWIIGDRVFVDSAISDLWAVYSWNGTGWTLVRQENDKVDTGLVYNSYIYNSRTNITDIQLNIVDPYKGYIVGSAERELSYKLPFDPAKYTNGDTSSYQIDQDQSWGANQLGKLWWDLSTVRFLDYEQGEQEYRFHNWGKIASGTSVDVYEWVRSPVPPSSWSSYITGTPALTQYRPSGTLKFGSEQPYVKTSEFNTANGRFETVYYFWVNKPSYTPPDVKFRNISALSVSQLIQDPNGQNVPWLAPISTDALLVCNVDALINDIESVLEINFLKDIEDTIIHREWLLMRENDNVSAPDITFWNKMRDSLVGFDDMNLTVPDTNLKPIERYGTKIRPRQSWFINRLQARKEFIQKANKLVTAKNTIDTISSWEDNLQGFDPEPASTQYDYKVFNISERDALAGAIFPGKKVLVESDQTNRGKWTLWLYVGGTMFTLLSQQLYKVQDYWNYIDWYATGYSSATTINTTVANIAARNSGIYNVGDVIKVSDNGTGRWALYLYSVQSTLPVYTSIGAELGTIEFNEFTLSTYDSSDSLLDLEVNTVIKQIIFASLTDLLTINEQNAIFFNMVHYVHTEQPIIDWAFKSSYIYGIGNVELLTQDYLFLKDQSENLISYINEVKPYHVKLRGLIQQKQVPLELASIQADDFHNMEIAIKFDRVSSTSSIPDNANVLDYDVSTLTAADRIQLLYKPTEGMPEKVLKQLISRSEFGGTILDGKNFYQFGTTLTAGYDGSEYDNMFGYDFDANDIESFYDVFVNGGAFNAAAPSGASDIIIDGYKFIQPDIAANHPEELVLSRTGDAISIDVYTTSIGSIDVGYDAESYDVYGFDYDATDIEIPFGGRPKARAKRFISTGSTGPFSIGQMPQNRQALFVYVDGDLLKETSDYTVNWGATDPLVTLINNPAIGVEIKIVSFSVGGSSILKRKTIRNTSLITFDLQTTFGNDNQVFVTVDGTIATFTTSGTAITITSPLPSNSTVFIAIFENNLYSKILTQEEIASGGVQTFTIDRPAVSSTPVNYATTIVHKNGLRLPPPYMKVYDISEPSQYYKIPETPINAANVRVWIDAQELVQPTDFTVFVPDNEIQLVNLPFGSNITILLAEGHQFEITGVNKDQLTILDGTIAPVTGLNNPLSLTAGDSIKITTFSEDLSLGIRTEVFNGNAIAFYPLGDRPFDTNSVWATVNGEREVYLDDYTLADKDNGYDSEFTGYGILYDSDMSFGVEFKEGLHAETDRIIVTYFTTRPTADPIGFKLFKNIFGNWSSLRISDDASTQLVQIMNSSDTEIVVQDSTVLGQPDIDKNIPGVIFINGERIIFWEVDTSVPGVHILKRILRGTSGTGINIQQPIGSVVRDGSLNQAIPGGYSWSYTKYGLQQESSDLARFLLASPGTYNYTV